MKKKLLACLLALSLLLTLAPVSALAAADISPDGVGEEEVWNDPEREEPDKFVDSEDFENFTNFDDPDELGDFDEWTDGDEEIMPFSSREVQIGIMDRTPPKIEGYVLVEELTDGTEYILVAQGRLGNWYALNPIEEGKNVESKDGVVSQYCIAIALDKVTDPDALVFTLGCSQDGSYTLQAEDQLYLGLNNGAMYISQLDNLLIESTQNDSAYSVKNKTNKRCLTLYEAGSNPAQPAWHTNFWGPAAFADNNQYGDSYIYFYQKEEADPTPTGVVVSDADGNKISAENGTYTIPAGGTVAVDNVVTLAVPMAVREITVPAAEAEKLRLGDGGALTMPEGGMITMPDGFETIGLVCSGSCGDDVYYAQTDSTYKYSNGSVGSRTLYVTGTGAIPNYSEDMARPWGSNIQAVVIAEGINRVGDYAFYGCQNLVTARLPETLTEIGNYAFAGKEAYGSINSSLRHFELPERLTSIGAGAFRGAMMEYLTIPAGVTAIGDRTFEACIILKSLTVKGNITSVGEYAFYRDNWLTTVVFQSGGPTSVGQDAFLSVGANSRFLVTETSVVEGLNAQITARDHGAGSQDRPYTILNTDGGRLAEGETFTGDQLPTVCKDGAEFLHWSYTIPDSIPGGPVTARPGDGIWGSATGTVYTAVWQEAEEPVTGYTTTAPGSEKHEKLEFNGAGDTATVQLGYTIYKDGESILTVPMAVQAITTTQAALETLKAWYETYPYYVEIGAIGQKTSAVGPLEGEASLNVQIKDLDGMTITLLDGTEAHHLNGSGGSNGMYYAAHLNGTFATAESSTLFVQSGESWYACHLHDKALPEGINNGLTDKDWFAFYSAIPNRQFPAGTLPALGKPAGADPTKTFFDWVDSDGYSLEKDSGGNFIIPENTPSGVSFYARWGYQLPSLREPTLSWEEVTTLLSGMTVTVRCEEESGHALRWEINTDTNPSYMYWRFSELKVVKNTGSNDYVFPYQCTISVNQEKWLSDFNYFAVQDKWNYGQHQLANNETTEITLYWDGEVWTCLDRPNDIEIPVKGLEVTHQWKNMGSDEILQTVTASACTTPVYSGETPAYDDGKYEYTFSGWNKSVDTESGTVTYTAAYTKGDPKAPTADTAANLMKVTVACANTTLDTRHDSAVYDGLPNSISAITKNDDGGYTATVSGNLYIASYSETNGEHPAAAASQTVSLVWDEASESWTASPAEITFTVRCGVPSANVAIARSYSYTLDGVPEENTVSGELTAFEIANGRIAINAGDYAVYDGKTYPAVSATVNGESAALTDGILTIDAAQDENYVVEFRYALSERTYTLVWALNNGTDAVIRTDTAVGPEAGMEMPISAPAAPSRANYTFAGWSSAANGGAETLGESVTLTGESPSRTFYAVWRYVQPVVPDIPFVPSVPSGGTSTTARPSNTVIPENETPLDPGTEIPDEDVPLASVVLPFVDVKNGAWYRDAVAYVFSKGVMGGEAETLFAPDTSTTRGMIATILYRIEDEPETALFDIFPDVKNGAWYSAGVNWGASEQIVLGYGDGRFGPEDKITREQLAAILYRYAQYKDCDMTARADLSVYTDAGEISGYALEAMRWAVAHGLIAGVTETTLVPGGNATRAEVAMILMRFMERFGA